MMSTKISFDASFVPEEDAKATMIIGKKKALENLSLSEKLGMEEETVQAVLESIEGPSGSSSTFVKKQKIVLAVIPEKVTRHNHPWSVHSITEMISSSLPKGPSRLIFVGEDAVKYQGALTTAVAKAFPVYSRKTKSKTKKGEETEEKEDPQPTRSIQILFWDESGSVLATKEDATIASEAAAEGVQLAARLLDTPPEELTTDAYAAECRQLADQLEGVVMTEIVGDELFEKGYGGIHGVGRAATTPPRLVIMEYTPPSGSTYDTKTVALVGKGVIYDTGGLSLKPKVGMCGMKGDMGGSAGMLGGFVSAVKAKYPHKLYLLLCIVENSIGPTAFRNDDILTMYSGKTVEVNNCDAEGRLILADGVAHATKHIPNLSLVVDMATLTGAQLVTTGKKHAGILATTEELEQKAVAAGLRSGDLCYPLLYAPELLKKEFNSKVADMKNSVKDRSNAQASCAGHFIEAHLDSDYEGGWLHVDMAGPANKDERGTGYGVGLVLSLLEVPGF